MHRILIASGWLLAIVTAASAADPAWVQTGSLAAPEAVQAAAADEHFIYAIGSTSIAKYDRQTGQRVASSRGDAKHLNSGYLWQGKLYCAHSNYPLLPEKSEIKVLDLETMELATYKDFGSYGGSLTWAVRHDDHWWCNFARYGDANGETFLVKFDDQWREQARWTYPVELIRQLGRYSLSGGIWRGDTLLVTGHDDRILFSIKLPAEGTVLELTGQQKTPFTGQGIADDPATGGLVGINRGKRQLVFAVQQPTEPLRLRVLSYNIHHAEGIDGQLNLARIARVIQSVEPDLVALQEVDQNVDRTGNVDQPAELARLTGLRVVFGGNIELQNGKYGNAVLSRFPTRGHENHRLPCLDDGEQRGVLQLELELPGGHTPLLLLATHLDHRRADQERLQSAKVINGIAAKHERPAILAGDLNAVRDSRVLEEFAKTWAYSSLEEIPTVPVGKPARQIDYVLLRPAERWRVIETKVLAEAVASDHRAILAVLELLPTAH